MVMPMGIFFCLVSLGLVNVSMEDAIEAQKYVTHVPTDELRQSLARVKNLALLLTYANNVFGPSVKMKTKKRPIINNITETVYIKGYALRTPDLNKVKFDPIPSNYTFYHETMTEAGQSLQEQRKKRGVLHLYNMVSCATGCNPLVYVGYGCYCGFLGSGYAVDGIDRCCEIHDWCYKRAKCPILEYVVPYLWKCYYNRPLCALDHAEFGGPRSCASKLCECDRALSECLSHYPCPSSKTFCRSSPFRLLHNALSIFP